MTSTSPLLKSTRPGYQNDSELMLEVKFDGDENWSKLAAAEPYTHNRAVSLDKQIENLHKVRDEWIATGPKKYYTAQYRVGTYSFDYVSKEYVWRSETAIKHDQQVHVR